jgi:hypothetical protein
MRRTNLVRLILALCTLPLLCAVSLAQRTSSRTTAPAESSIPLPYRNEISVNYARFSSDFSGPAVLNGVTVSAAHGVLPAMQVVAEIGNYRSSGTSMLSFLGGPRFKFNFGRFQPFVQALGGVTHGSAVGTAWSLSAGGGLDIPLSDHVRLRAIQAEFYGMRATPYMIHGSENMRLGAGVTYQFGGW